MTFIENLVEFEPGTKALSFEVNSNFETLKNANNDSHTKISNLSLANIKDYGAISGQNSTTAIDNALSTNKQLYIPSGSYIYTGSRAVYTTYSGIGTIVDVSGNLHPYFGLSLGNTMALSNMTSYTGLVNYKYSGDNASRVYILPKSTVPQGTCSAMKIFFDPYHLLTSGSLLYRDFGIYTTTNILNDYGYSGNGLACLNIKVGSDTTSPFYDKNPDIWFGFQDAYQGGKLIFVKKPLDIIPVMTSNTAPNGVAFASSEDSGHEAYKCMDKNPNNYWSLTGTSGNVGYRPSANKIPLRYALTVNNVSGFDNAPKDFTFEAWDGAQWQILDARSNITWDENSKSRVEFVISNNTTAYSEFRLNVSANNGGDNVAVSKLEIIDTVYKFTSWLLGDVYSKVAAGTASVSAGSSIVTGTGTAFLTEFNVTDIITINSEMRRVISVYSNTVLEVDKPFTESKSDMEFSLSKNLVATYNHSSVRAEVHGDMCFRNADNLRWVNSSGKAESYINTDSNDEMNFISNNNQAFKVNSSGHLCGVRSIIGAGWTSTAGDTTPTVMNANKLVIPTHTSSYTISNLDDGTIYQEVTLIFSDSYCIVANNANIALAGGNNFNGTANDTLTLIKTETKWVEKCRSIN